MLVLTVSDFHLGKGKFLENGQLNILEDFFEDDRFVEFLEFYSSGKHYWSDIHLVLNGDILNMIQIDVEGIFTHIVDESVAIKSLDIIYGGHKAFFDGLKQFVQCPNKNLTFVIGNHDAAMAFEGAQKRFKEIVGESVEVVHSVNLCGVHIEHGHRFEVINTVPPNKFFVNGPNGKKILNLPWGSLFCIHVLPVLKKDRPHLDKVRPMISYLKWTLLHDFLFFIRMSYIVLKYIISSRFDNYTKENRNFKTSLKILKQITIYPKYGKKAKAILRQKNDIHTVVMGHTHVVEWRRFPHNKYYFNSGTWNAIPSVDAGLHESYTHLTYVMIDIHVKSRTVRGSTINTWQGRWRPYREEISTAG